MKTKRVERHVIKKGHEWFNYCDEITDVSRKLFNTALTILNRWKNEQRISNANNKSFPADKKGLTDVKKPVALWRGFMNELQILEKTSSINFLANWWTKTKSSLLRTGHQEYGEKSLLSLIYQRLWLVRIHQTTEIQGRKRRKNLSGNRSFFLIE